MPWLQINGAPVGLSIIGGRGCDEIVLRAAHKLQALLPDQKRM
jgi:amidase